MAVVRKKQDDRNLKFLRELVSTGGNRQCFDCRQKGPTYVNMTIGSFVCTKCSGILRGLTPPHRVKSISMATFTSDEIEFLRNHGNDVCAKTWLGLWDPKRVIHQEQRELMIDKYERKRYYLEPASPLKSLTNSTTMKITGSGISNRTSSGSTSNNNCVNYGLPNGVISSRSTEDGIKLALNNKSNNNRQLNTLNEVSSSTEKTQKYSSQDSDFIADFSSASIFNATTFATNNKPKLEFYPQSSSNLKSNNTLASINNDKQSELNDSSKNNNNVINANENFADFDHAPIIYNAAADQYNMYNNKNSKNNVNSTLKNINNYYNYNNNTVQTPLNKNLFNFDNFNSSISSNISFNSSFQNIGDTAHNLTNNSNMNNNNNNNSFNGNNLFYNNNNPRENTDVFVDNRIYMNNELQRQQFQQQQQWPYCNFPSTTLNSFNPNFKNEQEQNYWSIPMSNSTLKNSSALNSSFNTNSFSTSNSAPSADRYAALKDLDEQLRENKASAAVGTFSNIQVPSQFSGNPFKSTSTDVQHLQQAATNNVNPFQSTLMQPNNNFAIQSQSMTNTFNNNNNINNTQAFGTPQVPLVTGFHAGSYASNTLLTNDITNGYGFHVGQQINSENSLTSNVKNPFTTSSLNSNNPFL